MLKESELGKGGIKDKFDSRDRKFLAMASSPFSWESGFDIETELSKILNISSFKLPVKDQGSSFSCGGMAWSTYSSILEAVATGTFEERSAKYIYAQTFVPGGGSYGRDNSKVCKKQGVARESFLTSYENGQPPKEPFITRSQDITIDARNDAKNSKSLTYAILENPNIDMVAQAIRDNKGVVLGVTGENNGTWLSEFPQPPKGTATWNHWIYAGKAKLINGQKHIGILNSWGKSAGNQGWQWISEKYFLTKINGSQAIYNSWTMIFDEAPAHPTIEEKKTNLLLALLGLYTRLLEALKQSALGQWVGGENSWARTGGTPRSPDWSAFRKVYIKKNCECCGTKGTLLKPLQLHHCLPFHLYPEDERNPKNVITLCQPCHLRVGHLMNFRSFNKDVKADSALWIFKIAQRP